MKDHNCLGYVYSKSAKKFVSQNTELIWLKYWFGENWTNRTYFYGHGHCYGSILIVYEINRMQ